MTGTDLELLIGRGIKKGIFNIEIKKEVVLKINSEVCVSTKLPYFIIPLLAQVCNLCPEIILKAFANYRKYLELKYNLTAQ